jgi:hypothetical protein
LNLQIIGLKKEQNPLKNIPKVEASKVDYAGTDKIVNSKKKETIITTCKVTDSL